MTRYVDKKHGLIIGSGNVFFFRDADGEIRADWFSIVWSKSFDFEQGNSINCMIRTPAQQLIWKILDEGHQLSGPAVWWLKKNVSPRGERWATRPKPDDEEDAIFFKRRKDALAFVRWIEQMLAGIKLPH